MKTILRHLEQEEVEFPDGGLLTPDRFLELGIVIGMKGKYKSQYAIGAIANNCWNRRPRPSPWYVYE